MGFASISNNIIAPRTDGHDYYNHNASVKIQDGGLLHVTKKTNGRFSLLLHPSNGASFPLGSVSKEIISQGISDGKISTTTRELTFKGSTVAIRRLLS